MLATLALAEDRRGRLMAVLSTHGGQLHLPFFASQAPVKRPVGQGGVVLPFPGSKARPEGAGGH